MDAISALVNSVAFLLYIVVGARIAPVALRAIRLGVQHRERDLLMLSWGMMWAAVTPLLGLRVYRIFIADHAIYQDWWVMDLLIVFLVAAALLMLMVDASIRRAR